MSCGVISRLEEGLLVASDTEFYKVRQVGKGGEGVAELFQVTWTSVTDGKSLLELCVRKTSEFGSKAEVEGYHQKLHKFVSQVRSYGGKNKAFDLMFIPIKSKKGWRKDRAGATTLISHVQFLECAENGSLRDRIKDFEFEVGTGPRMRRNARKVGALPEPEVQQIARRTAQGILLMHGAGFMHRDIKPENILCRVDGTTGLADFGLIESTDQGAFDIAGTLKTLAPEILNPPAAGYDQRCDWYSLGATLYELRTGRPVNLLGCVWFKNEEDNACERAMRGELDFPPYVSQELRSLICALMNPDPTSRLCGEEVLQHPFFGMVAPCKPPELSEASHPVAHLGRDSLLADSLPLLHADDTIDQGMAINSADMPAAETTITPMAQSAAAVLGSIMDEGDPCTPQTVVTRSSERERGAAEPVPPVLESEAAGHSVDGMAVVAEQPQALGAFLERVTSDEVAALFEPPQPAAVRMQGLPWYQFCGVSGHVQTSGYEDDTLDQGHPVDSNGAAEEVLVHIITASEAGHSPGIKGKQRTAAGSVKAARHASRTASTPAVPARRLGRGVRRNRLQLLLLPLCVPYMPHKQGAQAAGLRCDTTATQQRMQEPHLQGHQAVAEPGRRPRRGLIKRLLSCFGCS